MSEDLKRIASKVFKPTIRLMRVRKRYQSLVQQIQQIQEGTCHLESNIFRFQSQRNLTTKLERSNAERWYLIPEGTWRDMKNISTL